MTREKTANGALGVAIVGAGKLASFLAVALRQAGFTITEIVARDSVRSRGRARVLAGKVNAQAVAVRDAMLNADLFWFCVPDREIHRVAVTLAVRLSNREKNKNKDENKVRFAFHSSGALLSHELEPLRKEGVAIASVHPLMTFVAGANPSLNNVPFALEGDVAATRLARWIVRALGGESFSLPGERKVAYHAWAALTSPLLLAFLVTLEEAAVAAGLTRSDARRKSLPIIMQTLANYMQLGPAKSFTGPLVRGDVETVAKHLAVLKKHAGAREIYVALARAALRGLPVKNRTRLRRLLRR